MDRLTFYPCSKCEKYYFGGMKACEEVLVEQGNRNHKNVRLLCGSCDVEVQAKEAQYKQKQTWNCPECTLQNAASALACTVCGARQPASHNAWTCTNCTFVNDQLFDVSCRVCSNPKRKSMKKQTNLNDAENKPVESPEKQEQEALAEVHSDARGDGEHDAVADDSDDFGCDDVALAREFSDEQLYGSAIVTEDRPWNRCRCNLL